MAKGTKKSTKNFQKKQAKGSIKLKKRYLKHQRKSNGKPISTLKGPKDAAGNEDIVEANTKVAAEMNIDDFLDGGFEEAAVDSDAEDGGEEGSDEDLEDAFEDDEPQAEGLLNQGEDESSDDDDDSEDPVSQENKEMRSELARHKAQLEVLKQSDPEFYEYLKTTDSELLNFGAREEDESDEDMDEGDEEGEAEGEEEDEEEDGDEAEARQGGAAPSGRKLIVTSAAVDSWCKAAQEKASLGAVKMLLQAYRTACHYGDSEEEVEAKLKISSSAAFNKLMLFVLKNADGILRRMLTGSEGASKPEAAAGKELTGADIGRLPRWTKVEPLVKSYLGNSLHLLGQLTAAPMLAFALRRLRASVPLLVCSGRLTRRYLKGGLGGRPLSEGCLKGSKPRGVCHQRRSQAKGVASCTGLEALEALALYFLLWSCQMRIAMTISFRRSRLTRFLTISTLTVLMGAFSLANTCDTHPLWWFT